MRTDLRGAAAAAGAAGPGTLLGLHVAVKERMASIASGFWSFETRSGGQAAPQVLDFHLPPKDSADEDRFPFIMVRPRVGTDSEERKDQESTATVDLWVGTYADDDDGGQDVLLVIDEIRLSLGREPILDDYFGNAKAFEHVGPLTWEIPEEDRRPQWVGRVTTIWTLPRPRRVEARDPTED